MPIYPYQCPACDHKQEYKRSIHDEEPAYICEKCNYRMVRVYEPTVVSFKGGGFYTNDKNR